MTNPAEPLLPDAEKGAIEKDVEKIIEETRDALQERKEMALGHLIYAALDHACAGISHPDQTFQKGFEIYRSKPTKVWIADATSVLNNVWMWAKKNPIKVTLLVFGLGISAFKATFLAQYMKNFASSYCSWSKRQPLHIRFCGFVLLMSLRLVVSTLVPPTSPGFGIIIGEATPKEQKWTAMPCFLLSSAFAGACPWILDKLLWVFLRKDFLFTMLAKHFAENYPLTCWTGPTMREAFDRVYQSGGGDHAKSEEVKLKYGKLGASFAVIVAHVVPFMGAQTTIMQRFFLPHPLDTIASQPFGMTEDLISMAMAEAISNPVLASASLTTLVVLFNLARGLIFTGHTARDDHANEQKQKKNDQISSSFSTQPSSTDSMQHPPSAEPKLESTESPEPRDWVALSSACLNILVGVVVGFLVTGSLSSRVAFLVVILQMMVQLLAVPIVMGRFIRPTQRSGPKVTVTPPTTPNKATSPGQGLQPPTTPPTNHLKVYGRPPPLARRVTTLGTLGSQTASSTPMSTPHTRSPVQTPYGSPWQHSRAVPSFLTPQRLPQQYSRNVSHPVRQSPLLTAPRSSSLDESSLLVPRSGQSPLSTSASKAPGNTRQWKRIPSGSSMHSCPPYGDTGMPNMRLSGSTARPAGQR